MALPRIAALAEQLQRIELPEGGVGRPGHWHDVVRDFTERDPSLSRALAIAGLSGAWQAGTTAAGSGHADADLLVAVRLDVSLPAATVAPTVGGPAAIVVGALAGLAAMLGAWLEMGAAKRRACAANGAPA